MRAWCWLGGLEVKTRGPKRGLAALACVWYALVSASKAPMLASFSIRPCLASFCFVALSMSRVERELIKRVRSTACGRGFLCVCDHLPHARAVLPFAERRLVAFWGLFCFLQA